MHLLIQVWRYISGTGLIWADLRDVPDFGEAPVFMGKTVNRKLLLAGLAILAVLFCPSFVFAQGSIYGTVHNSDLTVPSEGDISFFGYLDDTDEEIRIDSSIGTAYDYDVDSNIGYWYDDFQNYLTEAPGNPYDFHFFNFANEQGFILSKIIPNNSLQQENITLAPVSWPSAINGLAGQAVSSSAIVVSWNGVPGYTYHVYRRVDPSYGSLFRIDDPTGSLSNPGVPDSFFVDVNTDDSSGYHYLVIAEDASGNLSPHSEFINVSSAAVEAPIIASVVPESGLAGGGTAITITGNGFDIAGVTATIGGAAVTSLVVVSPFEITGLTPPGGAGAADVVVTNTASGLSSSPLVDGFTYIGNLPPALDPIGNQTVAEGGSLTVPVSATDPDSTIPVLTASPLPDNAAFSDNGSGKGVFNFNPDFDQADDYRITIKAADEMDPSLIDTTTFSITVTNTNRAPELTPVDDTSIVEYGSLQLIITAYDPDGTMPLLTEDDLPVNADFTDNGDGTGTFIFEPLTGQAGDHIITFRATDEPDEGAEALEDSVSVTITVTNVNRPPQLLSPADGSIILDQSPTLDWSDVPGADSCEVWVDNSPMVNSSKRKYIGTASQWTVSLDLPFGAWYWKVRAYYPSGRSEWSVVFSFRICDIPDTPTLVRPLNGSTGLSQPISMDWGDVGGAAIYRLRIVGSQIDTLLTVSSFSASGLSNGTAYSWQVQAQNACGFWSGWSPQWSFTTDCPVPQPPSLVSPPDGDTVELVEIVWNSVSEASNYHLQVDTNPAFGNPEIDTMLTSVGFATTELADMTEYCWRVRAENDCGWSQWSQVWKFITNTPTGVTEDELSGLPNEFALSQNYPNPFNPSSMIDYSLSNRSYVRLDVFNLVGELVVTLVDEVKSPGRYSVVWNGKDQSGKPVPSGVYLYRLQAGSFAASKKMMLLK